MANKAGQKTEEDVAPNFWKWMIVALCAAVVLALIATGIFYYARGSKEKKQPSGLPQTMMLPLKNRQSNFA